MGVSTVVVVVGVAPFVLTGVFSFTMQLRGRPGLEYSEAGLRGREGPEKTQKVRSGAAAWRPLWNSFSHHYIVNVIKRYSPIYGGSESKPAY